MSLINDALRRAKVAHQQQMPAPAQTAPFTPVAPLLQHSAGMLRWLTYGGFGLVFLLICLGAWLWFRGSNNTSQPVVVSARTTAVAPERKQPLPAPVAPAVAPETPPVAVSAPKSQPVEPSAKPAEEPPRLVVIADVPPPAAEPPATPPPKVTLKLQAITLHPTQPSVIINGSTLFLGESFAGMQLIAVTRDSVRLVGGGHTNVLTLGN